MKSRITISKYFWLYLCQISLQIMLLPTLILHLDEIIKSAVVIRNFFSLHPATREPSLSERARKQWKKLIDVHENSSFKRQKKPGGVRHKGSWVKLLLRHISIVTRSTSHLVREMNQPRDQNTASFSEKKLRNRAIRRIFKISWWP